MSGLPYLSLFAPTRIYPWKKHMALLVPLRALTVYIGIALGWWGEPVRQEFALLRDAHPLFTRCLKGLTDWGNPLLCAVYVGILIRALIYGDRRDVVFCLRYTLMAVLFLAIVAQIFKYGLGLPRPGVPWPPHPWYSNQYASFPSGHTAHIIVSALPLAFRFHRRWCTLSLSLLIAGMGLSRLWLGMHHPIDLFGAVLLGSLAARLIADSPVTPVQNRLSRQH